MLVTEDAKAQIGNVGNVNPTVQQEQTCRVSGPSRQKGIGGKESGRNRIIRKSLTNILVEFIDVHRDYRSKNGSGKDRRAKGGCQVFRREDRSEIVRVPT